MTKPVTQSASLCPRQQQRMGKPTNRPGRHSLHYPFAVVFRQRIALRLGSTALVVQSDGSIYGQQCYYPYGTGRPTDTTLPTDYRFTGQRQEAALGLYDYGARFYDPLLGRFLSADTVVPQPGNPQALNRYAYVLNNPLKYTDPTGHASDAGIFGVEKAKKADPPPPPTPTPTSTPPPLSSGTSGSRPTPVPRPTAGPSKWAREKRTIMLVKGQPYYLTEPWSNDRRFSFPVIEFDPSEIAEVSFAGFTLKSDMGLEGQKVEIAIFQVLYKERKVLVCQDYALYEVTDRSEILIAEGTLALERFWQTKYYESGEGWQTTNDWGSWIGSSNFSGHSYPWPPTDIEPDKKYYIPTGATYPQAESW